MGKLKLLFTICLVFLLTADAHAIIMTGDFVRVQFSNQRGTMGNEKNDPGLRHDSNGTRTWGVDDYLTPGNPYEGFSLVFKTNPGGSYFNYRNYNTFTPVQQIDKISHENRSGDIYDHDFRWTGEIGGRLRIEQQTFFDDDSEYIMFIMKVTAISALYDVHYGRFIDPDPDVNGGGSNLTTNTRGNVAASLPVADIVSAEGSATGLTVGLYSQSAMPHNTAIRGDWSSNALAYSLGLSDPNNNADSVIGVGIQLGDFVPGQFKYFTFAYVMGPDVASVALPPEPQVFEITANVSSGDVAGVGGSITPAGRTFYLESTEPEFTMSADTGYYLNYIEVDGVTIDAAASYTFAPLNANHVITANYHIYRTITSSKSSGGSITPLGIVQKEHGSSQSYTVSANADFYLKELLVDGVNVGTPNSYTFSNITKNYTIHAVFDEYNHIIASASGNGTITPPGDTVYPDGATATFNLVADAHFEITGIRVDGVLQPPSANYVFSNVISDHTIVAEFDHIYHNVNLSVSPNGTGVIDPPGALANITTAGNYSFRQFTDSPTFSFDRLSNVWVVHDIIVDGVSQGPVGSYTISNITSSHNIVLEMEKRKMIDPIFFGTGF